jgi:hypothetical protein
MKTSIVRNLARTSLAILLAATAWAVPTIASAQVHYSGTTTRSGTAYGGAYSGTATYSGTAYGGAYSGTATGYGYYGSTAHYGPGPVPYGPVPYGPAPVYSGGVAVHTTVAVGAPYVAVGVGVGVPVAPYVAVAPPVGYVAPVPGFIWVGGGYTVVAGQSVFVAGHWAAQ